WLITRTLRNGAELAKPEGKGSMALRSVLFQERRLSHEDAIRRLQEMLRSRSEAATFFSIYGWPAFQRTYKGPLTQSAREFDDSIGDSSSSPPEKALATFIFTAIAVGDRVVQVETTAAAGAAKTDILEAQQFPQQAHVSRRQEAATAASDLVTLRKAKIPL